MKKKHINIAIILAVCLIFPYIFTTIYSEYMGNNIDEKICNRDIVIKYDNGDVTVDVEQYLIGLLATQIDIDYDIEAIKAQAVVLRTIICDIMGEDTIIDSDEIGLEYMSDDELKSTLGSEDFNYYYGILKKAVEDTYGEIMLYNNNIISPYYFSVSAGSTRNSVGVFNEEEVPYLISVDSEMDVEAEGYMSFVNIGKIEFADMLKNKYDGIDISYEDPLIAITEKNYDSASYVSNIIIGGYDIPGEEFRELFELNSSSFELEYYEEKIRIICKGIGHGVGMSQYGANYMAQNGEKYDEILKYYFANIEIAIE